MKLVKYLDPGERLGEAIFGLIMVLTFTLAAGSVAAEGEEGTRELLVAALGCNIAWGIIDGAMYLMASMLERGRRQQKLAAIRAAPDEAAAAAHVAESLDETLASLSTPAERAGFYRSIAALARRADPPSRRITRDDWMGALACFWIVFATTLPAALPFLFIRNDPLVALRVSNGLMLVMLFGLGWVWARYAGVRRLRAGLLFLLAGVVLVNVAIALGG